VQQDEKALFCPVLLFPLSEGRVPLIKGQGHVGDNIREFRTGKTFARTENKFGKKRAEKQALAVALHEQDQSSEREYGKPASISRRK
jgi:hypothetical protein